MKGRFPILPAIACAFFGCVAVVAACILFPRQDGLVIDLNSGRVAHFDRGWWQAPQIQSVVETQFSKAYLNYVGPYPPEADWHVAESCWRGGLAPLAAMMNACSLKGPEVSPDMESALVVLTDWMEYPQMYRLQPLRRGFADAGRRQMIVTALELLKRRPKNPLILNTAFLATPLEHIEHPVDAGDVPSADEYISQFRSWSKPRSRK